MGNCQHNLNNKRVNHTESKMEFNATDDFEGVEIEVVLKTECNISKKRLIGRLDNFFENVNLIEHTEFMTLSGTDLEDEVESLKICSEMKNKMSGNLPRGNVKFQYMIFKLNKDEAEEEDLAETGGEEIVAASSTLLPSVSLQGLWESLIYDTNVKEKLLSYIQTSLFLAEKKVDPILVGVNRVVLLHGPPGTGKTSLCKALAQKLTIRVIQSNRFDDGVLVEINSHSLFSKWFSESGKLVQKMFEEIKSKVNNSKTFVCVLIDEVESLTAARKNSGSGLECSDAVRVVNALLTEIDKIKQHTNVLILTTSNITGSIDLAFVDRADIKQYVGPPSPAAVYEIYLSAINELRDKGVISSSSIMNYTTLQKADITTASRGQSAAQAQSLVLWRLAGMSEGFSGRTLRKIPFHALAMIPKLSGGIDMGLFLESMKTAVKNEKKEREGLDKSQNTA